MVLCKATKKANFTTQEWGINSQQNKEHFNVNCDFLFLSYLSLKKKFLSYFLLSKHLLIQQLKVGAKLIILLLVTRSVKNATFCGYLCLVPSLKKCEIF